MDRKEDILNAWIMVEHLSEGDINLKDKSLLALDYADDKNYYSCIWNAIERKKFNEKQNGGVVIFFEIFDFKEVVTILREKYDLQSTNEDIRYGNKFSFALCFDKSLKLCSEMTFFTVSAYIRWNEEIVSRDEFRDYESNFKSKIALYFNEEEDEDRHKKFNNAIEKILNTYSLNIQNCRIQVVNNIESNVTNLHSFFIDDLENAKSIETDIFNDYILGKVGERVNLDSKKSSDNFNREPFIDILQPKNYPISRFPSKTEYSLSFMQQVAVNLSIGYDNKQIRSVNGPPGTGKTTLLKDIFAELVVEQALDISYLPEKVIKGNDNTKYFNNARIGEIPTYIAEKGIVVASSNNSAVQNIVNELPIINDIDKELIEELKNADYFTRIANSEVSTEWVVDENGNKKEELIIEHIAGEDKFWGLFSLEGGKTDNMRNIITNIKHIINYLDDEYISDDGVYDEFVKQYRYVDNVKKQLQEYVDKKREYNKWCRYLEQLKAYYISEYQVKERKLEEIFGQYKEYEDSICKNIRIVEDYLRGIDKRRNINENNRNSLELNIHTLLQQKPGFFASRKIKLDYNNQLWVLNQQLLACVNISTGIEEEERQARENLWKLRNRQQEIIYKQNEEQFMFNKWIDEQKTKISDVESKCAEYEKEFGDKLVTTLDMELDYEKLQQSNPWFDEAYRIAQSKLFILALRVRKQFLYENIKNVKAAIIIWDKQNEHLNKKHIIVAAWNWINMVVPVISSTFASFSRMCKNLDEETLGHLFIDEAGQALPQASVGAIYRSKHVMVVGDPSQIKPVLTLDSNVLSMLGEHFSVSKKYLSNASSTQTLIDEISQYGYYKEEDDWIGIPLWVHRRCQYPMFTISNKISYKGMMVQGDPRYGKADWYDIRGIADDKYVKEQGDFLVKKIKEMVQENPKIIDKSEKDIIYVITPFSNVAYHLAQALKEIKFTRFDEHGKPTNVGTIHTFQGKEAPIVFLVLGADKNSRGAAGWTVDEPNMMNVAATRAKEEFYVIGDKSLYLNLGCDVATDTYKIIDQHKKMVSRVD